MRYKIWVLLKKIYSRIVVNSKSYILQYDLTSDSARKLGVSRISLLKPAQLKSRERVFLSERRLVDKWLLEGAYCCGYFASQVQCYGWLHLKGSRQVSGARIEVLDGDGWSGPDFVDPSARGQGLHREMIDYRISLAKTEGLSHLITGINVANCSSLSNYKKVGFKIVAEVNLKQVVGVVLAKNISWYVTKSERCLSLREI